MAGDGELTKQRAGHRDRLRQRMREAGEAAFEDYELLEYLLTFAHRQGDTKAIAKRLIAEFGSFGAVLSADPADLERVKGCGETSIAAIKFVEAAAIRKLRGEAAARPVLGNWRAVTDYLRVSLADQRREQFRILLLDTKNVMIADRKLSQGTVDQAAVYIREILTSALEQKASALILVHNHPSGDPSPSRADIVMTKQIVEALKPLHIYVHDHLIVGAGEPYSMKANGLF